MKYRNIIFVCENNRTISPAAEAILKSKLPDGKYSISSRGLSALFPEPYNPKVTAVLMKNDIILENGVSTQLVLEDFSEDTLVLTMNRHVCQRIKEDFENAENVFPLMEFCGGSGDIMDPYGGNVVTYKLFFEAVNSWVSRLADILNEGE